MPADPPGVTPVTWPEFYQVARAARFQFPQVVQEQVEALKPACTDLAPYVFEERSVGVLLFCKGKMLNAENGKPSVFFVITIKPQFPNAYPILTIEQPPAGWRIKNHPHVDREGLTYLNSVTQWNPRSSKLFDTCAELQQALMSNFPYEPNNGAAPPQQPQQAPQQQQPRPVQQQQQQQQQPVQHQYPQQARPAAQPVAPQQQPQRPGSDVVGSGAPLARMIVGAMVGVSMAALGSSPQPAQQQQPQQQVRTANGQTVPVLAPNAEEQARQQRERDRLWLERQQASRDAENQNAQAFAKERFAAVLSGTTPLPPGTEVAPPAEFGLGASRIRTHPTGVTGPLILTRFAAQRPLAPVTEPTPEDHFQQTQAQREAARLQEERRQATEPPPSGALGFGFRALSRGVTAVAGLASSAKASVENKVKQDTLATELQRFALLFPGPSQQEQYCSNYHCKMICGDGIARAGYLFITNTNLYFSTKPVPGDEPVASGNLMIQNQVPFVCIVSLQLGSALDTKCLHVICRDNSVRTFLGFHSGKMVELGSYVSSAVTGTALDRCYNWVDHKWRAAVAVPVRDYPYQSPITMESVPPSAPVPPASQAPGAMMDIPVPGPMYAGAAAPNTPAPLGPAAPGAPAAAAPARATPEDMLCAICMDNPKNCFLRPCGHVAACMGCAAQLRNCPMCRAAITDRFQAFL